MNETIWALKDVSFEIKRGEVVGIIGRNGAGKSTLLKILSRITEPTEGQAAIYGRVGSLLEVGTGFHPELTGRENIYLNGAILGMRRAEIERKFDEIVVFSGVEKFIDTPVKHYSSGMYLRLAFAVAAHLEPEILLVDEVLAVGDAQFQKKCLGKMADVAQAGRTVLFVSHNMGAIHHLCPRSILLEQGRIAMVGATAEVIRHYLSKRGSNRAEYMQPSNPKKPINLRRAYLTTLRGEVQSDFNYTDGLRINIEYEINQSREKYLLWLRIRTTSEVIVFETMDFDVDRTLLDRREVGYYHTFVDVPGKWLNAGDYTILICLGNLQLKRNYDRVKALDFTILNVETPSMVAQPNLNRLGVLQPILEWKTEKLAAPTND